MTRRKLRRARRLRNRYVRRMDCGVTPRVGALALRIEIPVDYVAVHMLATRGPARRRIARRAKRLGTTIMLFWLAEDRNLT